ncbi:hypothetical protein IV203_000819 [Nitzschia inconspicua]|uniref:Uncharacterized protein n=1 Tax=Nitzschia inconspicua TaxID=303405 RepID=A0A9K3L7C6_9STRA|nr:hypothetical protein IV203_000819 [Nitzschia inconspicua]
MIRSPLSTACQPPTPYTHSLAKSTPTLRVLRLPVAAATTATLPLSWILRHTSSELEKPTSSLQTLGLTLTPSPVPPTPKSPPPRMLTPTLSPNMLYIRKP